MATCEQLALEVQRLHSEFLHVFNEDAQQAILDKLDKVETQQQQQGCFDSIFRTLNGKATLCTDSSFLPGPKYSQMMNASLGILLHTGVATLGFLPLPFDSTTVSQSGVSSGLYDFTSGSLDLSVPIHVVNVPVVGTIDTVAGLSTMISISAPCESIAGPFAGSPAGSPADATGFITLVGTASISVLSSTITAYLRIVGTLS